MVEASQPVITAPLGLKTELRPFQVEGFQFLWEKKLVLLGDQPGLGKSIQALSISTTKKALGLSHKTLVLCPNSTIGVWQKQILEHTSLTPIKVMGNPQERREQYLNKDADVFIASYHSFLNDWRKNAVLDIMKQTQGWGVVILDEVHRIGNPNNKITTALVRTKLKRKIKGVWTDMPMGFFDYIRPEHVLLLTGTPISNSPEDVYSLMKIIAPGHFGTWSRFKEFYVEEIPEEVHRMDRGGYFRAMEDYRQWTEQKPPAPDLSQLSLEAFERWHIENERWKSAGIIKPESKSFLRVFTVPGEKRFKNLDDLRERVAPFMIRRLKRAVLKDLPPITEEVIPLELSAQERAEYDRLRREYKILLKQKKLTIFSAMEKMHKAQQLCNSMKIFDRNYDGKNTKLEELKEQLQEIAHEHKVVIFSNYETMTSLLYEELDEWSPVHLHGGVPTERRQDMVDLFQNDDDVRIFISTIKTGGESITLTSADVVYFYDKSFSLRENLQARDRVDRIGQKNPVFIKSFLTADTIEERVEQLLLPKQKISDEILGDQIEIAVKGMTESDIENMI